MVARNDRLGLDTPEEQATALKLANTTFQQARKAIQENDGILVSFLLGYLSAIENLAEIEGAKSLAREVGVLIDQLENSVKPDTLE